MSSITLRMLEVENFGRFYDTTRLIFEEKSSAVILGTAQGKSTFVDSLEFLSRAVLDGKIYNSFLNVSKMCINKPKTATRVEVLIDIVDANHKGSYRYGLGVSDIGVISEFLMKESSGRRIFYRYKNEIELDGLPASDAERIKASLDAKLPILYLLTECTNQIVKVFIHFFQRLWVIRSDFTHNPSALHLFKSSFFVKRENVTKCCEFLRLFDPTVVDIIKNKNSSKIYIVHRNIDRYDYPVALSKESGGLIKFLALYRAYDALATYGGLVLWDAGDVDLNALNCIWQNKCFFEEVGFVFFTPAESMYVNTNLPKAKLLRENL